MVLLQSAGMSSKRQRMEGVVARIEALRRTMSIDRPGRRGPSPLKLSSPQASPRAPASSPKESGSSPEAGSSMSSEGPESLGRRGRKSPRELEMNKVQEELEKLNIATDVINKLELQLDDARSAFGEIRSSWTGQLETLSRKLGGCIAKSRPYYEAKLSAKRLQEEAQKAALRFERANSMHAVAKQQVALTQDSLFRQDPKDVDPACLEVLNHHVARVNDAELERLNSEEEHRRISILVEQANKAVSALEKDLGRQIKKSKTYFDRRLEFTRVLEDQKGLIQRIEQEVRQKKLDYQTSLRNLERISERIHEERRLGDRGSGVGAEDPDEDTLSAPASPSSPAPHCPDPSVATVMVRIDVGKSVSPAPSPLAKGLSPKVKDLLKAISPKAKDSSEEAKARAASEPPKASGEAGEEERGERSGSLSIPGPPGASGVLLIAQQLSEYGWLGEEGGSAFAFPPEDLDVAYKTLPEGVKAFPSPPETPLGHRSVEGCLGGRSSDGPMELGVSSLLSPRQASDAGSLSDRSESSAFGHRRQASAFSAFSEASGAEESDASSLSSRSLHVEDDALRGMLRSHTALIQDIDATAERLKQEVSLPTLPTFERQPADGDSSNDS